MSRPRRAAISSPPAHTWKRRGAQWECPACGKGFHVAGQGHSCGTVDLADHFEGRAGVRELFDALVSAVEQAGGPLRLSVARTRIGLVHGITFAAVMPRQAYLRIHILLPRRLRSRRVVRVDRVAPYWVHFLEIRRVSDLDDELRAWLREAWQTGASRLHDEDG